MRVVEDEYGNKFLEIENEEDLRKFREDLLRRARKKANASEQRRSAPTP